MRYFLFFCACLCYGQITQGGSSGGGGGAAVPGAGMVKSNGTVLQTASPGADYVANLAYSNANTAKTSNLVIVGDSHMAGVEQSVTLPSRLTPTATYTTTNLAVSGIRFCTYWADYGPREQQVDALYNPLARSNILIVEGGGNDVIGDVSGTPSVQPVSPQQVFDCQRSYALRRKAVGWQILLYPMYSRSQIGYNNLTGDQLHNQLNALYDQGWRSFADAYMPHSPDTPAVWNDNDYTGSCFVQTIQIHVTDTCAAQLAPLLTAALNQAEFGTGGEGSQLRNGLTNNLTWTSTDTSDTLFRWDNSNATANGIHSYAWDAFSPGTLSLFDTTASGLPVLMRFLTGTSAAFDAGVLINTNSRAQPACAVAQRGALWFINGGAAADAFQTCSYNGTAYAWQPIGGTSPIIPNATNGLTWTSTNASDTVFAWNNSNSNLAGIHNYTWDAFAGGNLSLYDLTATGSPVVLNIKTGITTSFGSGVRVNANANAKPTCAVAVAGTFWYVHTNNTTKDDVQVCAADATATYAWRTIY
jgi:hypothetical protein